VTRAITLAGYVVIVAAAVVLEMRARRTGRATVADALALVMSSRIGKVLIIAAWLWLGWHLFARAGDR
jgi:Family of unknown function (DUF6186)